MNVTDLSITLEHARIYIRALVAIARIDGLIPVEVSYVELQADLHQVNSLDIWDDHEPPAASELRSLSAVAKKMLIRDAIALAHIDKNYSDNEHKSILEYANIIGLSEDVTLKITDWLNRYWQIIDEGSQLFGDDNNNPSSF